MSRYDNDSCLISRGEFKQPVLVVALRRWIRRQAGGANHISLLQGRENFIRLGACDPDMVSQTRPPQLEEIPLLNNLNRLEQDQRRAAVRLRKAQMLAVLRGMRSRNIPVLDGLRSHRNAELGPGRIGNEN